MNAGLVVALVLAGLFVLVLLVCMVVLMAGISACDRRIRESFDELHRMNDSYYGRR